MVVVDDAHNHLAGAKPGSRATYTIPPAEGFMLDATGYTFSVPPQSPATSPNAVQVVIARDKSYTFQWSPSKTRYRVSAASLTPLKGSSAFRRLEAGTTVVIAIGYQRGDSEEPQFVFYPFWAGLVEVR